MVMPNEASRTRLDDTWLPFQLQVLVGGQPKPVLSLTRDPRRFADHLVEVTELLPLSLLLVGEDDLQLEIFWDDTSDGEWNEERGRRLTPGLPLVLYSQDTGAAYPWRCGQYRFKVKMEGGEFYGGFEVVPKNITESQLKSIHQLIEKHVQGLIYDYFHSNFHEGGANPLFRRHKDFYEWYMRNEKTLLSGLKKIEAEHDWGLVPVYVEEWRQAKPDLYSVRWTMTRRGHALQGKKFLNRRLVLTNDTLMNRYMKWRLRKLEKLLVNARDFYVQKLAELADEERERDGKMSRLEAQIERVSIDFRAHPKSLEELHVQMRLLRFQHAESERQKAEVSQSVQGLELLLQRLRAKLSNPFWRPIPEEPAATKVVFTNPSYFVVDQILRAGEQRFERMAEGKLMALPAHRPTSVLYEYYVYYTLVEVVQELGWKVVEEPPLTEQTIVYEGLPDGYTIRMRKENEELRLVFNEEVFYGPKHRLVNRGFFYTNSGNRKPDIRLERHRLTADAPLQFQEAWIIEVKYRPLYYIYSEDVMTSTEDQLCSYSGYRYTWRDADGRPYPRIEPVVKKVVCVYPGTVEENRQVVMLTSSGMYYVQLCPEENRIRGRDELREMMKEWLG